MRKLLQIIIVLFTASGMAQLPQELLTATEKTTVFDSYVGSIYSNDDYQGATVVAEKTGTFKVPVRYNIFNDAIECEDGSQLYELAKTPTTHVRIGDDYFYYCKFKSERGFNKEGYYVLVELTDFYRVYKKYELDVTEAKAMDANTGAAQIAKIETRETYFLEENGTIVELPTNKKDLLAVFSDKEEALKEYMKEERIKPKKEEDLLKFVAKYNGLRNLDANPTRSLLSNRVQNN
ncbi:hypothetical protein [Aquimarina brevivitae]|nr:hypothetical protein [Aquimarina brevivitae]